MYLWVLQTYKIDEDSRYEKYIRFFFYLWCLGFVLQMMFGASVLEFLMHRASTTEDRGLTSFAPEPSISAAVSLFFYIHFQKRKKYIYVLAIVLLITFVTRSPLGLLYLLIFECFKSKNIVVSLLFGSICAVCFYLILSYYLPDSRVFFLMRILWEFDITTLTSDASVASRFLDIITVFKLSFIDIFYIDRPLLMLKSGVLFYIYSMGVFGFFFIYLYFSSHDKFTMKKAFSSGVFSLLVIACSSIPLHAPFLMLAIRELNGDD